MRSRRPVATVVGGVLLTVSLLVCGVGSGLLLGPVSRSGQDIELASAIGDKGYSIFDMYEGDDYWIYQPVEESWPDSVECDVADSPGGSWVVRRSERPSTAPDRITHFDARGGGEGVANYQFGYYGTLRGDRTKAFLSVECTPTDFLVVPSRAPRWHLAAVGITGGSIGIAGIAVLVTGLIRRRRRSGVPTAAAPAPAAPVSTPTAPVPTVPPTPAAPVPAAPPATLVPAAGPSRRAYLLVIPLLTLAVLVCCVGGIAGLSLGFSKTFDPPNIGSEQQGVVGRVMDNDTEYALYADQTGEIPSRDACAVREREAPHVVRWRTGRPIGDPKTVTYNGHTYSYVGTLRIDDIIIGIVDCHDKSSLLLRPSRRSWPLVWGSVIVAALALTAAAAAGLTIAVRRRRTATPANST